MDWRKERVRLEAAVGVRDRGLTAVQAERLRVVNERARVLQERGVARGEYAPADGTFGGKPGKGSDEGEARDG